MKYVVDCSVGIKWVLPETDSDKALRLREASRQGQHELIAPDWFMLEVMNVLGKAAARGTITSGEALQHYSDIVSEIQSFHPSAAALAPAAFRLALQHQRAAYDCLYLALARISHEE